MAAAWAYIRVSGDEQADRGLPVAGQRRSISEYAEAHNLSVERWFVDEARTGKNDHREQFQALMAAVHQDAPPVTTILLWSWARFARDQNDAHFWKASCRRHGIEIRDISGETPVVEGFEYVLESLIHWKDEQKLREISSQARRGQQTLAKLGYVPSGSEPPRGFRVATEEVAIEGRRRTVRRWVPDPATWPLVELAWRLRLQGASYRTIIEETGLYHSAGSFVTFFANPIYRGELIFGGTVINVPAVVTAEEWGRVNTNRAERHSGAHARRQGSRFALSGLVYCARCGSALSGDASGGSTRGDGYTRQAWRFYRCGRRRQHDCNLPRIHAGKLEEAVIAAVFADVLSAENLAERLAEITAAANAQRPELEARLEALDQEARQATRGIGRLLDAIESRDDNAALLDRLAEREAERDRIQREIANLRAQLAPPDVPADDVATLREELRAAVTTGKPATVRLLLAQFIQRVDVDDEEARITYKFPFATGL